MPKHALHPETWIDQYADQMLGYTVVRVANRDIAKDLVQETFFVALRSKDNYRGEISEKNWLYLILRSRILDHYKKKKEVLASQMAGEGSESDDHFGVEDGIWRAEAAPAEWEADRMVQSKEFMHVLNQCRSKLSDMQQAVFTMKFIDGESSDDICKELDLTSSNYWVLVHRAKLHLRKCLEMNWMT